MESCEVSMKKYFRFTKKFIEEVKTLKKRERYYDTLADGLVLSVTSAGAKSFYVKFWRSDQASGRKILTMKFGWVQQQKGTQELRIVCG